MQSHYDELDAMTGAPGIATGIYSLDEATGGLHAGEMVVVAARPSIGKTALALQMATNIAAAGTPVGFLSLEMTRGQIGARMMGQLGDVDLMRIRRNQLTGDEYQRMAKAIGQVIDTPFRLDCCANIPITAVRAKARHLQVRYGIRVLFVDYLQLIRAPGQSIREQVVEVSRSIKGIAGELNIPVVVLSQLNRMTEDRKDHRPRMSDLRESGSIEQDADVVMLLHREDYYRRYDQSGTWDGPTHIAEVDIAKQRNGPTGKVELTFVPHSTRFREKT
jgi:replicative DNA helicase